MSLTTGCAEKGQGWWIFFWMWIDQHLQIRLPETPDVQQAERKTGVQLDFGHWQPAAFLCSQIQAQGLTAVAIQVTWLFGKNLSRCNEAYPQRITWLCAGIAQYQFDTGLLAGKHRRHTPRTESQMRQIAPGQVHVDQTDRDQEKRQRKTQAEIVIGGPQKQHQQGQCESETGAAGDDIDTAQAEYGFTRFDR